MSRNKVLKTLLKSDHPLTIDEIADLLSSDSEIITDYINTLVKSDLVIGKQRPYDESLKYSRERLDIIYHCSSLVPEYLRNELWNRIAIISSVTAAIASVAALIIA